jgi:hypothetical protein
MPTQSEIERTLVLLYRSNNASDHVNYTRPAGWLDKLPLAGLDELASLLNTMRQEVVSEMANRMQAGEPITLAMCGCKAHACKDNEHDFKGWRDFADGNGGEQVCTKCGMGAMQWSLRVGP